ncbi:Nodulation protein NolO [Durusdinium trenchii]|uniref:Nodulation protein NolO n=1 Tax=Durusdinium trenchii TaxID=1381693 RepID=A0ABP0NTY0_9DINO
MGSHVYRMRYLLLLIVLGALSHLIGPDIPYIENTFFAQGFGGGDCEAEPSSKPCRRGAARGAEIFGWSHAAANLFAMMLAVFLGSLSDAVGRRPLIRAWGVAQALPLLALFFHLTTGFTLWAFVVLRPMVEAFDVNGVFLAIMSDAIEDPEERPAAFGSFMASVMLIIGIVMPFGFLLPRSVALAVSLGALCVKLLYIFLIFPETAKQAKDSKPQLTAQEANPLHTAKHALEVLSKNFFISRLAVVLVVSGLAGSGYAIVMPPFMMGYLGVTRKQKLCLAAAAGVSALVGFGLLMGPLVARFGPVRVLRMSLAIAAVVPLAISVCQDQMQLTILVFFVAGPLIMSIPLVSALKSALVSPSEQGLVQGAIASITKGAATLGFVLFSVLFGLTSNDGEVGGVAAVLPVFGTIDAWCEEGVQPAESATSAPARAGVLPGTDEWLGRFKLGITVWGIDATFEDFVPSTVQGLLEVEEWQVVSHHMAHAALAFYSSPFRSALVVSYDGGGDDGTFNAYRASPEDGIKEIARLNYNFGDMYMHLAELLPEVTGKSISQVCRPPQKGMPWSRVMLEDMRAILSLAGKLMGYSGVRAPDSKLTVTVKDLFKLSGRWWEEPGVTIPSQLLKTACNSTEGQQTLAASIQEGFDELAQSIILTLLKQVGTENVDGVVLTGGCALNVLTNQHLHDHFETSWPGRDRLHVPAAPNDCGLSVGGLWAHIPPPVQQPLPYLGFRLWDEDKLESIARKRGACRLSSAGGVEYLADLLTGKLSWHGNVTKPVVAVVRGRQEFGPRALGHRSLLASPDSAEMKERMNRLKARQWYRPVAPMIAAEDLVKAFGRNVASPYMSMAPRVVEPIRALYPALAHVDGTARHQSVGKGDEPWIHALLLAVGRRIGLAALINTSFNTKGLPIVNSVRESLQMLDTLPDLDFVLIEDWLFQKRRASNKAGSTRACGYEKVGEQTPV